jgi:hypothetical protein
MEIKDRIDFRRMQSIFFAGMVEYPNDTDRMEKGMQLLEQWIDRLVNRECSKFVTENSSLTVGGVHKGGKLKN